MDMFPDANLVREIQQELDSIIQVGVRNITRLIRATEAQSPNSGTESKNPGLRPQSPSLALRRARASKPQAGVKDGNRTMRLSLGSRLVQDGLLTPELLQQLQSEWSKDHNENGNFTKGTAGTLNKKKKKKKK